MKFPKVIEIQTQTQCNARCKICPHQSIFPNIHPHSIMDESVIYNLIDQISEHRNEISKVIPYLNNEPFLDRRMITILKYIKEKELKTEISTNASVLTPYVVNQLLEYDLVDELKISFFSAFEEI